MGDIVDRHVGREKARDGGGEGRRWKLEVEVEVEGREGG